MRTRSTSWSRTALAALVAALTLVPAATADARTVRVFAMNPKLDLTWLETRESYRAKLFALSDTSRRGGGAPRIQDGADDVQSNLRGPTDRDRPVETARDLVVWPEDLGLFAALTGPRAAPARASGSLEGSILTLIGLYASQGEYYTQKHPDLTNRPLPVRTLMLALTDTFGRTVIETAAELAIRHRAWLEMGVNMAQEWQVVCNDRDAFNSASPPRLPGGQLCQEENRRRSHSSATRSSPGATTCTRRSARVPPTWRSCSTRADGSSRASSSST